MKNLREFDLQGLEASLRNMPTRSKLILALLTGVLGSQIFNLLSNNFNENFQNILNGSFNRVQIEESHGDFHYAAQRTEIEFRVEELYQEISEVYNFVYNDGRSYNINVDNSIYAVDNSVHNTFSEIHQEFKDNRTYNYSSFEQEFLRVYNDFSKTFNSLSKANFDNDYIYNKIVDINKKISVLKTDVENLPNIQVNVSYTTNADDSSRVCSPFKLTRIEDDGIPSEDLLPDAPGASRDWRWDW